MNAARQGEVWFVDLDPTRGREQVGSRPAVTVSVDTLVEIARRVRLLIRDPP